MRALVFSFFMCIVSCGFMYGEETFSMIKPRAVKEQHIGEIIAILEKGGLKVCALKMTKLRPEQAKEFYKEHEGKPFFNDLVEKMTSGPIVAMCLSGDDAVVRLRTLIGNTNPEKADAGTVRALFGKGVSENAIHGSDSVKSAEREIAFFFSENEVYK